MNNACFVVGAVLWWLVSGTTPVAAQRRPPDPYDPKPASGDVAMPLPGGGRIIFRVIQVPGMEFWSTAHMRVGNSAPTPADAKVRSDLWEIERDVVVAGSFHPDPASPVWTYYIGKYEVSNKQFIDVMGDGDPEKGWDRLTGTFSSTGAVVQPGAVPPTEGMRLRALTPAERDDEYAYPVAWLDWASVESFVNTYNRWCFRTADCLAKLPKLDDQPGYFRLPTEVEWEYAARGGLDARNGLDIDLKSTAGHKKFEDRLPFEPTLLNKYAVAAPSADGKARRIGSRDPVYGLHDMLGNVQELTLGVFQPEIFQGKPGALIARGGDFRVQQDLIRTSYRTEVPIYHWDPDTRQVSAQQQDTTGFRLAIGSAVVTPRNLPSIKTEYAAYRGPQQQKSPAGATVLLPTVQLQDPIADALAILSAINVSASQRSDIDRVASRLNEVSARLEQNAASICLDYASRAMIVAEEFGRNTQQVETMKRMAAGIRTEPAPLARMQALANAYDSKITNQSQDGELLFERYVDDLKGLRSCGPKATAVAIEGIRTPAKKPVQREAISILREQAAGPADTRSWRQQLESRLGADAMWQ